MDFDERPLNTVPLNTGLTVYIKKKFQTVILLVGISGRGQLHISNIILNKGDKHCMISGRYFFLKHDPCLQP